MSVIHFVLLLNKEEFDETSRKKTEEIKNLDERMKNLMKSSQQKNPMKVPDQISSSAIWKEKSNKKDLEPEQIKELWLSETHIWQKKK